MHQIIRCMHQMVRCMHQMTRCKHQFTIVTSSRTKSVAKPKSIRYNKTLTFLDLENNCFTSDGTEFRGIYQFFEFLDNNKTLISQNIANNDSDETCDQMICEKLANNTTLIYLDFSKNQFSMEDFRQIQEYLKIIKAAYDTERVKE